MTNSIDPNRTSVLAGRSKAIGGRSNRPLFIGAFVALVLAAICFGGLAYLMYTRPVATPLIAAEVENAIQGQGYTLGEDDNYRNYEYRFYEKDTPVGRFEAKIAFESDTDRVVQIKVLTADQSEISSTARGERWRIANEDVQAILPVGDDFERCRGKMRTYNIGPYTYTNYRVATRLGWDLEISTDEHSRGGSADTFEVDLKERVVP